MIGVQRTTSLDSKEFLRDLSKITSFEALDVIFKGFICESIALLYLASEYDRKKKHIMIKMKVMEAR